MKKLVEWIIVILFAVVLPVIWGISLFETFPNHKLSVAILMVAFGFANFLIYKVFP